MGSDIITHMRFNCPLCKVSFGKYLMPSDDHGQEELKNYKAYQPLRNRITAVRGSEKLRSLKQLNTYWAACKFTADNLDNLNPKFRYWNTKDNVDFQLRVALDFRNTKTIAVTPDGSVVFKYKSIAFRNLKHILACRYFDQAFELMAHVLKYKTTEEFIKAVQSCMIGGN